VLPMLMAHLQLAAKTSCLLIVALSVFCSPPQVKAQQQSTVTQGNLKISLIKKSPPRKGAKLTAMEEAFECFDKPLALPDISPPGNAKFVTGRLHADDHQRRMFIGERFGTKSSPQDVINYFSNSLLANKWKISSSTSSSLRASKSDINVVISMANHTDPKMTTDFYISYNYSTK